MVPWDYHTNDQIKAAVAASGVARESLFITAKIPCGGFDGGVEPMNVSMAKWYIDQNLAQLNTSYLDLLLLHHRCHTFSETAAVWAVLEATVHEGKARAIGVSNFNSTGIEELQRVALEPIAVNQCHFAVGEMDIVTLNFCERYGCFPRVLSLVWQLDIASVMPPPMCLPSPHKPSQKCARVFDSTRVVQ
jgi:diketogulonate reductase-like aldo/keto reductase